MAGTAAKDTAVDPVPPPHGTRTLHEGRFLALRQRGRWEFVQRTNAFGAAVVVALTDADEIVLVEQYREPLQCRCIENPAGLAGDQPGEDDILAAAGRELLEETGFEAAKLEFLMAGPSAPGNRTSEKPAPTPIIGVRKLSDSAARSSCTVSRK